MYDRCCSVGPAVVTDIEDPHSLALSMSTQRDGDRVYYGGLNALMERYNASPVQYYTAHKSIIELQ